MLFSELFEAKNYSILYHHTKFSSLIKILTDNKLVAGSTGYVSFTRNKNFSSKIIGLSGSGTEILINGSKLSERYKITPFKYQSDELHIHDESEERVKGDIKNVLNYIVRINLYRHDFENLTKRSLKDLSRLIGKQTEQIKIEDVQFFIREKYSHIYVAIK